MQQCIEISQYRPHQFGDLALARVISELGPLDLIFSGDSLLSIDMQGQAGVLTGPYAVSATKLDEAGLLTRLGSLARLRVWSLPLAKSDFQARVWQAVARIASGQTLSYTQLAEQLGMTRGARAVARALALNPLPLFLPCHRVLASSGALQGYRLGLPAKKFLLEIERGERRATGGRAWRLLMQLTKLEREVRIV